MKAVINQTIRKKLKRRIKRHRKEAMESVVQADKKIERLLIRRFDRLISVRRFTFLWISLFGLMIFSTYLQTRSLTNQYQVLTPVPGGLYSEGILGSFTNSNPLYATGAADAAISRLVFSGLFKYDNSNKLVGDLATGYNLDDSQKHYVVKLRQNVTWQDGRKFDADDVVFTYKTIQNIGAQSPLYSSWLGINVTKIDKYNVAFDLPNALSSFPYSLTNGIVPQHLLAKITPAQLRSDSFNTSPVGTGPFKIKYIEVTGSVASNRQQRISLTPFSKYWDGKPSLDGLSIITYPDDAQLISAFEKKQLNAVSGLEALPAELASDKSIQVYRTPLTTAVMAFFNNSHPIINDAGIRKALAGAVDKTGLVSLLGSVNQLVDGPLLKGQLGYDPAITQEKYNSDAANLALDSLGWVKNSAGIRYKDGQPLALYLSAQSSPNYVKVAQYLQQQWAKVGAKITINYYDSSELQSSIIGSHAYDILLYGISIGVDPDVYAYWDSSQASLTSQGHLNLSEYKSPAADTALEAGRTRSDPSVRAVKYRAFTTTWVADAPAVALYQPNFIYITKGPVFNYERAASNTSIDRFYNVNQWMVRQQHKNIN